MRSEKTLATVIFLIIISWAGGGQAFDQTTKTPYKAGELLIKYKSPGKWIKPFAKQNAGFVRSAHTIGRSQIHRVILKSGATVEQALKAYAADPDVEIAEPNYLIQAQAEPNDTEFSMQWGLNNTGQMVNGSNGTVGGDMDAHLAWDLITDGSEVIVAVVDTGCDINHPDLAANLWKNPKEIEGDGIDNDNNGFVDDVHGWDFADGDNNPYDASGHGTHVAGIIAAVGNNELGISGVAWKARIMPVRTMNAFDIGTTADAIASIEYAVKNGAKIINCSWGGANYSSALQYAIANANALFVCAAGNQARDTDSVPYYPASYDSDNIISVAASNQTDQLAYFSNYGTITTDVVAPGTRIYSLINSRQILWSNDFNDGSLEDWSFGGLNSYWKIDSPSASSSANALGSDPDEQSDNITNTWAQLPTQNLDGVSAALLTFKIIGSDQDSANRLYLEISTNGTHWTNLPLRFDGTLQHNGITGPVPYWTTALADLGRWDGMPNVYLRLRIYSNTVTSGSGLFIDDMRLTVAKGSGSYQFMQGTSMAAGFVSGLAALIRSQDPSLSNLETKFIIENSVDLSHPYLEKIASGGRINAYNALTLLRELSVNADMDTLKQIHLSWTTAQSLDGPIVIQRRLENEMEFSAIAQVDAATHNYVDEDVSSDVTYYYRIQTQSKDGQDRHSHQTLAGGTTYASIDTSNATIGGGGSGTGCFLGVLGSSTHLR